MTTYDVYAIALDGVSHLRGTNLSDKQAKDLAALLESGIVSHPPRQDYHTARVEIRPSPETIRID